MVQNKEARPNVPDDLHTLMEHLLDGSEAVGDRARAAAVLSAALDDGDGAEPAELGGAPERSVAQLAAYLDGGLDEDGRKSVRAVLAASPSVLQEAASAAAFADAFAARLEVVPEDLLQAALAPPANPRPKREIRWSWPVLVVLAAAAFAAILIVMARPSLIPDGQVPVARSPSRSNAGDATPVRAERQRAPGPVMKDLSAPSPDAGPTLEETPVPTPPRD